MATQEHEKTLGHAVKLHSIVADIHVDIIMMIVDTIYQSRPPCRERIQDT